MNRARLADTPQASLDELLERHAPLVARIASHLKGRLPETVARDDLIQAGMIGLLEAAQNFRQGRGAVFETFAGIRIRGAMLDEVRRNDWVPRSVYRKARELSRVIRQLEVQTGSAAQPAVIAAGLGIALEEYHHWLQEVRGARLLSVDEPGFDDIAVWEQLPAGGAEASAELEGEERREQLRAAIASLPGREGLVLSLYYDEELNLREIGEVLGVSESRVCQLHSQAIARLRARMAERC
ncbi:MAG: RNA polymerase sigma factor FliA [Gammaproteobacteria bacterium]|nr:RNA polymerase sigma factor FliA [Gammaproteobacteria bacterium]